MGRKQVQHQEEMAVALDMVASGVKRSMALKATRPIGVTESAWRARLEAKIRQKGMVVNAPRCQAEAVGRVLELVKKGWSMSAAAAEVAPGYGFTNSHSLRNRAAAAAKASTETS